MVDVDKVFKNTVKKGEVKIGAKESTTAIKNGKAQLVVIAQNCPDINDLKKQAKSKKVPVYMYESNSIDLGYACGKAFAVSAFVVLNDGGSNILQLVKKR
jgi:large subunit ribosomal protein L30e